MRNGLDALRGVLGSARWCMPRCLVKKMVWDMYVCDLSCDVVHATDELAESMEG